jgi:phage virion morphogenesis protein
MTGVTLTAKLDDAALQGALKRLSGLMHDPGPLLRRIGAGLVIAAEERFQSQTDPWGRAWHPLTPAYAPLKTNIRILTERGHLRGSMSYRVGAHEVSYGTPMIYGAIHQFGGTIKPKNAKALAFPLSFGGVVHLVRAHSVFIPARPYLGMGPAEIEAVELATDIQVKKALRG